MGPVAPTNGTALISLAGTYNIIADQGASLVFALVLRDARMRVRPLDFAAARMQVRESDEASAVLLEASSSDGRILLDGASGRIDVRFPTSVMRDVRAGEYVYDLEVEYEDGEVERVVRGRFTVRRERTR